ncbi:MAG: hypothetical protein SXA11_14335 [Cyanobacteriota bacterium]|nr:hypothetical protein [Cyanobacteriota bacterium]
MKSNLCLKPTTEEIAGQMKLMLVLLFLNFLSFVAFPLETIIASNCNKCSTEGGNICCPT